MSVSDHLFNAIGPALRVAGMWAPLADRRKIADAIETYLRERDVILVDARYLHGLEGIAEAQTPSGQPREASR